MGRINNSFGYDTNRTKKYGKFYNSIDFEVSDRLTEDSYTNTKPLVGNFKIGNQSYMLTLTEINHIIDTLNETKNTLDRKYQLGLMRK